MPGPAARVADMTAHGGVIMPPGVPTVLIGGMPAATITGMHVCPMITVLVPHVGGPILPPGVPTVLIGGLPAATVGDMATCVGPPDVIIPPGCPTVLIGTGGGGSGSGGGGAAASASESAYAALVGEPGPEAEGPHWIEYQFKDSAGNPITGVQYEFTGVDANVENIKPLTKDGIVRRGGLPDEGECNIKLLIVYNAKWSANSAKVGDELELSADVEGYEDGTPAVFDILEKDIDGMDDFITRIETTVDGGKVEGKWVYEYQEDDETIINSKRTGAIVDDTSLVPEVIEDEGKDADDEEEVYLDELEDTETDEDGADIVQNFEEDKKNNYSSPEYYFIAKVKGCKARSDLVEFKCAIEIALKDATGNLVGNAKYKVYFDNGEIKEGTLDSNGYKKVENAPTVAWSVEFPEFQQVDDFTEE